MEGLYYNSPITAMWMLLASLFLELPAMLRLHEAARALQVRASSVQPRRGAAARVVASRQGL